jgi:hypothetical protein
MSRFSLGITATLILPQSEALSEDPAALSAAGQGYGLQLAFATGDGPTQFTLGPSPAQPPLSLDAIVRQIAKMLDIDAVAQVASLTSSWPWSEIFAVQIAPYLTVAIGDAPAVQLVIKLYNKQGDDGIGLGGTNGIFTVEPNFTVYDLIVGYDKAKGGLDVRARVKFAEQNTAILAQLAANGSIVRELDGADEKTSVVSYPFPVPSQGGSNFEVKYFGLGQRFGPTVDVHADDPIAQMFCELEATFTTNDPKRLLDSLAQYYDPTRDWFVAAHLIVRGWEIRAVFNDPALYGLEVTCSADQFKGLLLEILYQKLGPHLGVYYGALTMPEKFRKINLGAVALTLPSFKIWIYTNGDFKVSVGWPLGENSIGLEVYIFTGGAAFYFGKLRSGDNPESGANALRAIGSHAVSDAIEYNPIVVFGLGVWFGLGRSINAGPFSASLSLTAQATFQGILAWEAAKPGGGSLSREPDYFWFAATAAIVGQLQGEVDLSVVKLTVLVRLSVIAGIAFETGYGTVINVTARVDVEAKLRILFITISVGFHTTISTSFQITGGEPASLDGPRNPAFHGMNDWAATGLEHFEQRLLTHNERLAAGRARRAWFAALPLAPEKATDVALSFLVQPSAVYVGSDGKLVGVATLIIRAPEALARRGTASGLDGPKDPEPTELEKLVAVMAEWLLRTWSGGLGTWKQVAVNLGQGRDRAPSGWAKGLHHFLATEVTFTIDPVDLTQDGPNLNWALFPMFDVLQMTWTGQEDPVVFADHARTYPDYSAVVEKYFAELSLNALTANPGARGRARFGMPAALAEGPPQGPSLTSLIFDDYFVALARQMATSLAEEEKSQNHPGVMPDAGMVGSLAGLTSRYLMNGMRLPDPATTPPELQKVDLNKLDIGAGYALSGQQFTLHDEKGFLPAEVTATLSLAPSPQAAPVPPSLQIHFAGGASSVTSKMLVQPAPVPPSPIWTRAGLLGATSPSIAVSAIPAMHAERVWYAARDRLPWISHGTKTQFVAPLPSGVLTELRTQPLTLTVQTGRPNTSDRPGTQTVSPALMIQIPISLVNRVRGANVDGAGGPVSPFLADVYRISGTNDETRERIHAALTSGSLAGATITVLYDAATTGFESDAINLAAQPVVLAKTNLSTSSQPAAANVRLRLLRAPLPEEANPLGPTSTLFPDPNKLVDPVSQERLETVLQLVWEASVTHAGGFFLRYADAQGNPFPIRIFTPKGQPSPTDGIPSGDTAIVTLLVIFPTSTRFEHWHNAFAIAPQGTVEGTLYLGVADAAGTPLRQFQPSYPPGCLGFEADWALAHLLTRNSGSLFDPDWVAALYHLMQFQVNGPAGQGEPSFGTSLWSLALSPSADSSDQGLDDASRPDGAVTNKQTFRQVVPVYRFVRGQDKTPSPYAAVGGHPNLVLKLNDVFGNALDSDTFTTHFDVLYNDALLPPSEWPGVRTAYRFEPLVGNPAETAALALSVLFDPTLVIRDGSALAMMRVHSMADGVTPTDDDKKKQQIEVALFKYATIAAQLADPNTGLSLTQSVLPANSGVVGDGAAIKAELTQFVAEVIAQLQAAYDGGTAQPVPMNRLFPLQATALADRSDNIFPVTVTLTLSRPPTLVDPDARTGMPRAVSVAMPVAANLDTPTKITQRAKHRAGVTGEPAVDDVALTYFATQFEAAFRSFDGADGTTRLAVRSDVPDFSAPSGSPSLWGVRWSATKGIHATFLQTGPSYYTLAPLSKKLWNRTATVPTYDPNTLAPTYHQETFAGIDLDGWAQTFLAAVDDVLSPATAAAIAAVDSESYHALMEAKAHLAQALGKGVVPVFPSEPAGDRAQAQDQFEQSVLSSLGTAYAVSSIVQVPAEVAVAGKAEIGSATPRFFGSITTPKPIDATTLEYAITSSKLPIKPAAPSDPGFLTFLVTVTQPDRVTNLQINPAYQARFIEHLLDAGDETYGYAPSEWLRIVLDLPNDPLTMPLGPVDAPVPIRAFPTSPVLQRQSAAQTGSNHASAVADPLLEWNYSTTLTLAEHEAQDELWIRTTYNRPLRAPAPKGFRLAAPIGSIEAVFDALASFITAWPVLRPYLSALPQSGTGSMDLNPTPAQIVAALLAQVRKVSKRWGAYRGITDRLGQRLFASAPPIAPPPVSDPYVLNFANAFNDKKVLTVFAQAKSSPDGCDEQGIVWPLINGGTHGPVKPAGAAAPDDSGCWFTTDYDNVPPLAGMLDIVWPQLDVVTRQTGSSAWWIVRNANISDKPGVETNPDLIYQTAEVSFASPVVPTIVVPGRTFPSGTNLAATLEDALALFAVAGSAAAKERLLKLAIVYRRQMGAPAGAGDGLWSEIPVLLAAGVQLSNDEPSATPSGDKTVTLRQLAATLAKDIDTWFGVVAPLTTVALLNLEVVLFADVDGAQLPIVQAPVREILVPPGWWPTS